MLGAVELYLEAIPLWMGLIIAVGIGILYPRFVRNIGYGPAQWDSRREE